MPIIESILGRISGDILYKGIGWFKERVFKPNISESQLETWKKDSVAELIWHSNYLDEIANKFNFTPATKVTYYNRSTKTQKVSLGVNIARIKGPLHGPLRSIYPSFESSLPGGFANVLPGETIEIDLQDIINRIKAKPIVRYKACVPIQNKYPKDSIININDNISLSPHEVLLHQPLVPYDGVGITIRVTTELTNGYRLNRYAYGGRATIDPPIALASDISSSENCFYKYLDGLVPFGSGFIDSAIKGESHQWFNMDNLECFSNDSSETFLAVSKNAKTSIACIKHTSDLNGLVNFGQLLLMLRKTGPIEYDARI